MTNKVRRILFIAFVFLFFSLAGIILPYSLGYKLNISGMKLQRTGMFDIKTTPSSALIYLNDKKQTSFLGQLSGRESATKTPTKLKNIIPGTYQVKLELDGYWPWSKRLTVKPSETTYLEDVYFFKKNQPNLLELQSAKNIQEISASPDSKHIAIITKTELKIFAWDKAQIIQTMALPADAKGNLSWSPSGQKIAYGTLIIDWRNQIIVDLKNSGIKSIVRLAWVDDNQIYFQEKNEIKKLNLKSNELVTTNLKKSIGDFLIKDGYLYLINQGDQPLLVIIKLNSNDAKDITTINLRTSDQYYFINLGSDNINFQETSSKKLYTISAKLPWQKNHTIKEISALTAGQWIGDSKLIFSNDFELNLWTKDTNQTKLLTRVSHPIISLVWHKSNNYVVFATDQSLNTIELDDRDTYNIITLLDLSKITYPIFNQNGTQAFFFATVDGQSGFYLLEI